jgi:hypothetical protein
MWLSEFIVASASASRFFARGGGCRSPCSPQRDSLGFVKVSRHNGLRCVISCQTFGGGRGYNMDRFHTRLLGENKSEIGGCLLLALFGVG